jgi:transcriptional regulator with XRE-family HTH domain
MNDSAAKLGAVVRAARKNHGVSVDTAAMAAGISPVTWRRVEHGKGIYTRTARKMEDYFGVPWGSIAEAQASDDAMDRFEQQITANLANRPAAPPVPVRAVPDAGWLAQFTLAQLQTIRYQADGIIAERERSLKAADQ